MVEEEVVGRPLALEVLQLRLHVDGLVLDPLLVLGRADIDAQAAAGAIVRGHLQRSTSSPGYSLPFQSADLKPSGAPASRAGSKAFMRIVACGQPSEHSPHWMQIFGSQMGMSWAMLRFSYCVVPVGNVPSRAGR